MIDWWTLPDRVIAPELLAGDPIPRALTFEESPGALRILSGCGYDPGSQAYRLHSALNETTADASVFARLGDQNPYGQYRQFDLYESLPLLERCLEEADIVVCHMNYMLLSVLNTPLREDQQLVRMYHGSVSPEERKARGNMDYLTIFEHERDDELGALQLGARWDHVLDSDGRCQFLGMTIPVQRYARLRTDFAPLGVAGEDRPLRVGHSPTYRAFKGTDQFLELMAKLRRQGLPVEVVLIEKMQHAQALRAKATCDVFFDSFWLGAQGSGLEAMAMGIPVIAGDHKLARLHREHVGYVPWLFADRAIELEQQLVHLLDPTVRHQEATRQFLYVNEWHRYEAVAERFKKLVKKPKPKPVSPAPEPVVVPQPPEVVVPPREPMRTT